MPRKKSKTLRPTEPRQPSAGDLPVDLVRSRRRRRTYRWWIENDRVRVELPSGLGAAEEARIAADVAERARRRLARAALPGDGMLLGRARDLARKYVPEAASRLRSVVWSRRQGRRWGSCTADTGAIRLSTRLEGFPQYVVEAVLVHELAHFLEPNHSPRFRALAEAYPLAERARGFLEAVDRRLLAAGDEWADGLG